jgi:hypothetical protein
MALRICAKTGFIPASATQKERNMIRGNAVASFAMDQFFR